MKTISIQTRPITVQILPKRKAAKVFTFPVPKVPLKRCA
jgi:hypothetical protein